jgi:membrane protein
MPDWTILRQQAKDRAASIQQRLPKPVRDVIEASRDSNLLLHAAGLAFYALISVAPSVVVGFWIAAGLAGQRRMDALGENLAELVGSDEIESTISQLADVGAGVGAAALVAALWPASAYGSGLVRALDHISDTPKRSAQGIRGRLKMALLIALLPVTLLGALVMSYVVTSLIGDDGVGTVVGWGLAIGSGWLATTMVVTVVYLLYGPLELSLKAIVGGAALVAAAMAIMSAGYLLYLQTGADWEERVAGSGLATVVLLGLWLYLTNLLLLAGYFVARETDEHVLGRHPADQGRHHRAAERQHTEDDGNDDAGTAADDEPSPASR